MPAMTTFLDLLAQATTALRHDGDPDGLAARQALLLATHAATRVTPTDPGAGGAAAAAGWDLATVVILDAVAQLQAGLDTPVLLADGLAEPGADHPALRAGVTALLCQLADRYAAAAAGETGPPWRRLVWAHVAHRLDDAARELA